MSFFQVLFPQVSDVMSGIGQQQQIASQVLDTVKGYVPKVQAAWVGNDANEFAADVARKLVPATLELIAAIAGMNLNLTKAQDVVKQADNEVSGLADQIGGVFDSIF
ncbi:MAG: WXG100 family type VII secretion target [Chloroflexota bacterium]